MPTEFHKQFAAMAIEKLGGSTEVAELFGVDERLVSNWTRRGLPPDTYDAMAPLLRALKVDAPPVMWRQRMVVRKRVGRPPRPKSLKQDRPVNGKQRHRS